jgi:hypothetical protein
MFDDKLFDDIYFGLILSSIDGTPLVGTYVQ